MFLEERRGKIMTILSRHGRCLVSDLAQDLKVSEVTIRQDLDALEQEGLLRRTHGGAILNSQIGLERPFQIVETSYKSEKERIATAAAGLIAPGDTVILDVGTTVTELAKKLTSFKDLTVFTNALNIAAILEVNPEITTIVTGGALRAKQHSLVNPYAELIIKRIHADIAFIGISGIHPERGLTNVNIAEAEMKSLFIKNSHRSIVLADSSKIGKIALAKVADISEVDLLITDKQADPAEVSLLQKEGLELRLV